MATAEATTVPWIDFAHARRFLGVGRVGLDTLIDQQMLTVRRLPGCRPKLRADEVLALAHRATRAAEKTTSTNPGGVTAGRA